MLSLGFLSQLVLNVLERVVIAAEDVVKSAQVDVLIVVVVVVAVLFGSHSAQVPAEDVVTELQWAGSHSGQIIKDEVVVVELEELFFPPFGPWGCPLPATF